MSHSATIDAGHAADVRRVRELAQAAAKRGERRAVARLVVLLRSAGVPVTPRAEGCDVEVGLRPASAAADYAQVYALLDVLGWWPQPRTLQRHGEARDLLRLAHRGSGALLCLRIVKPAGVPVWDTP